MSTPPQSFFEANPHFASNPFYVFGESYGGHFVPAFCHHIYTANQQLAANAVGEQQQQQQQIQINLKVCTYVCLFRSSRERWQRFIPRFDASLLYVHAGPGDRQRAGRP